MKPIRTQSQKTTVVLAATFWRTIRYRTPFRPSTGTYLMRSFQLTSRLLCRLLTACRRSADLTGRSLRTVAFHLCPRFRAHVVTRDWSRHAEGLLSRFPSFRRSVRRASGSPGVFPGCFRCVTVGSTWRAACPFGLVTGTSDCVAPSSHVRLAYIRLRGVSPPAYSVRSAHIFVSGFLKGPLPALPLPPTTLHGYLSRGWTCPLNSPNPVCHA